MKILEESTVIRLWHQRAWKRSNAHHAYAARQLAKHRWLGGLTIFVSALVGSTAFKTLFVQNQTTDISGVQIVLATASIATAVLAAMQTFLNYAYSSSQHRAAAARWECIRWDLEILLTDASQHATHSSSAPGGHAATKSVKERLENLCSRCEQQIKQSPVIPNHFWRRAERRANTLGDGELLDEFRF